MPKYQGRLELTWTNKNQCLLAQEDGSYEWLPSSDYRVAEVRLLHEDAAFGVVGKPRAEDNLVIQGDALHALGSLVRLPEFAQAYLGKVQLAYIDPPFNTQQTFDQYDDALEHSVWLTMMRDRLVQIRDLLSPTGSVWVHCDDEEQHRLRSVMDEVFGPTCFAGTIIWRSSDNSNNDAKQFSTDHNYLIVYGKSEEWLSLRLPASAAQVEHFSNPDHDPDGPWFDGNPLNSPTPRENLRYPILSPTGMSIPPPPNGWRWSKETLESKLATGEIRFNEAGTNIIRRTYLKDHKGLPATSLWTSLDDTGHNRQAKAELKRLFPGVQTSKLFATPKPEKLLRKILAVSTEPGDIVLDCFAGSGTTAAVAHKMGRRWVVIERSQQTIETYVRPRLEKVVSGTDLGGVTISEVEATADLPTGVRASDAKTTARVLASVRKSGFFDEHDDVDRETLSALVRAFRKYAQVTENKVWHGGGGFRMLRVARSMFEESGGLVFLAEGLTNGALAEATAAQMGFVYESIPPFAGRKGRTRLAVIDGVVNEGVVRLLVQALLDEERVVVCGTGIDREARTVLQDLRPGSTLRKIPAALLDRYRSSYQKINSQPQSGLTDQES